MGFQLNNAYMFTLQFYDDQDILAQDKEDLVFITWKIKDAYEKWGLSMNIYKTKYMYIGNSETVLELQG